MDRILTEEGAQHLDRVSWMREQARGK